MKKATIIFCSILFFLACSKDPGFISNTATPYDLQIPYGLPALKIPANNPMTVEGVALGRKLFYDNILSANNTMNCGSCHALKNYFTDSTNQFSKGIDGIVGTRNAMPLFNIGYSKKYFWDGGAADLESQVIGPITNPIEMHENLPRVMDKLNAHPEYPNLFKKAFGITKITSIYLMRAIAQFERTLLSGNSKYDQWKRGETTLTAQELNGLNIYETEAKGDCVHCHSLGSTFSDFEFRNTGLDSIPVDKGRGLVTQNSLDDGKFKTPSLRNIANTSPYMHDGRFTTLQQCIEHYNSNFKYTTNLDATLRFRTKNSMTQSDIDDLIAFLHTLTDTEFINKTQFDKP